MKAHPVDMGIESLGELASRAEQGFDARFSAPPDLVVAAPGRVNLIGEHIDYNDGFVLPMAIERYVVIAASPCTGDPEGLASLHSIDLQQSDEISWTDGIRPGGSSGWARYIEGVIAGFLQRERTVPSFNAVIHSNVPLGGGLSSSAALEVAAATLLELLVGTELQQAEKALLCQQAEHQFAGVPCGIMDQFSSVFGKPDELMLLDCRSQEIRPVPFAAGDITVLITNSNVKHELAGGEYAERRQQCDAALGKLSASSWREVDLDDLHSARDQLSEVEYRRARHVVGEIQRTRDAADAFATGDWDRVGQLMYASHASLRDDYEVSCDELDILVDLALQVGAQGGVVGSRMTGGGFGGCTVSLVRTSEVESIMLWIAQQYECKTGIKPHSFASRPALGAHVIRG